MEFNPLDIVVATRTHRDLNAFSGAWKWSHKRACVWIPDAAAVEAGRMNSEKARTLSMRPVLKRRAYSVANRPTMILDVNSRVETKPKEAELRLWDGVL
jgi:hypothetical protein